MDLNSKSYLCDFLQNLGIGSYEDNWDLCEKITEPQRKKLLALCFNKKVEEAKKMLEEIKILQ